MLEAPATLYVAGALEVTGTMEDCLDGFRNLGDSERRAAEMIVDGISGPDGGHIHWRATPADCERLNDARAVDAFS